MTDKCDCEAWIPEGYICGKPECPRTKKAEAALRRINIETHKELDRKNDESNADH
jgi:hypothetical protein